MLGKSISASVGRAGRNAYEDVRVVQYLLNCVPAGRGGPARELIIDGACGPLTTQAITGFQRALRGPTDGRVDPGGQTLQALQSFDPYPARALPAGQPAGKSGSSSYGQQGSGNVMAKGNPSGKSGNYGNSGKSGNYGGNGGNSFGGKGSNNQTVIIGGGGPSGKTNSGAGGGGGNGASGKGNNTSGGPSGKSSNWPPNNTIIGG